MERWKKIQKNLVYTSRSLALAWHSSPPGCASIVLLTLISAGLPLAIAYVGKLIIDAVVATNPDLTFRYVLVELGLISLQALVQRLLFLCRSLLGAKLGNDVNVLILEKTTHLELRHFEDSEIYDQLTRARREASTRPLALVTDILQLLQNTLTLAGYIALLTSFSRWGVAGMVLAALPATLAEMRFSNAAFRLRNWRSPETRKLNYVEYVLANDAHVKEVKVFGLTDLLLNRYRSLGEKFYKEDKRLAIQRTGWAYGLSLLAVFAFYACYAIMAVAAARGTLSLGNLTLYVLAFRQGQQAFQSCLTAIGSMYEHNLYLSNLFQFLAIPTTEKKVSSVAPPPVAKTGGLRFENVGFRYPGQTPWALRNINLEIEPGKSLALVGHNGAGKTTFIKLICNLYEPTEGRILLDGVDLRDWDPSILRRRIGIVFQDFNQYHFSLRENVGMGNVEALEDEAHIRRAIERGGAAEVLQSMPEGLETTLGRWFRDGKELSGGQWQKIALARAFMREDADILILDEPTAALDARAEHEIFERFRSLTRGRTTILISHRFPTVRMADRIVVIEEGHQIESGTHESLLAAEGRYAELFRLQASGYR